MVLTRRFEEKAIEWYVSGTVPECPHSSIGQEAVGVGACYGLRADDQVMPSLRTRAAFFVKGASLPDTLATMLGRRNGYSGGRDDSHHAGVPEVGVMAGLGIVGGSLIPSVGAALAMKLQKRDSVVVSFFGDGAANSGDFHEGLNFAGVQRLPVVFVCESNEWAQATTRAESMLIENIAIRASSYGFPGEIVDGNDVLAVYKSASSAVQRARAGEGPTLIECKTFRWRPHCELAIFQDLWKKETQEVEEWREKCPIQRLEAELLAEGLLTEDKIAGIRAQIDAELEAALEYGLNCPKPEPQEALEGIYAQ
jgi:pyruvate dehydrogenase E1 component alpha subunit